MIIVAVIVAAAISFLLYFKDKIFAQIEAWKKWVMTGLRFFFVLIILLLLLNPVYKSKGVIVQKPIVVFVQDNSKSILLNRDSSFYKNEYLKNRDKLLESFEQDYDVRYLQFSEFTSDDSVSNYDGELTDISSVFPEVISRFSGMNLGAVIIATDGIYNHGINPAYSQNVNFPVYSIALGDTIAQKDLILKDLMHNKIAFLGNRFPIRVFVSAEKCEENESILEIKRGDKIVYSNSFTIPESGTVKTLEIELPADRLGVQEYNVSLKNLSNEISYENNISSFVVNVIDNRNKILLLANAPHPDIGAIKFALKDNPDFELEIQYANEFNGSINDYDLVIFHQLPSIQHKSSPVYTEISKTGTPALFILGASSSLQAFNNLDKGLTINSLSNTNDDAQPVFNQNFKSFSIDVNETDFFGNLSPLKVFFGDYKVSGESKVLLYQKVNGVKTEKPLILFTETQDIKVGFIAGEGLWKWRIDDYKNNSEHTSFNSLVNRIVQFMIVKKMKDKLLVEGKQVFSENEQVILSAEFYNEAFELVPELDIELVLTDNEGKEFKYFFSNFGNAYRIDLGRMKVGSYSYIVNTKFDDKDYSTSGQFIVQEINVEALNTTANHIVLSQLAEMSGGKVFYPNTMNEIPKDIMQNSNVTSIAYERERLFTITDLFWIFFVILGFAAAEWILRKYWGGY